MILWVKRDRPVNIRGLFTRHWKQWFSVSLFLSSVLRWVDYPKDINHGMRWEVTGISAFQQFYRSIKCLWNSTYFLQNVTSSVSWGLTTRKYLCTSQQKGLNCHEIFVDTKQVYSNNRYSTYSNVAKLVFVYFKEKDYVI